MQSCDIHHEWMISDRPAQHSTVAVGQVRSLNRDDIMGKKISKLSSCNLTKHMTPNSSCDMQTWCPRIKMSTNLHVAFITVFDWAKLLCPTNMSFRIRSSQAIRWPILKKGNLMQQEQTFIQTQIHNNTLGMFWVGRGTGGDQGGSGSSGLLTTTVRSFAAAGPPHDPISRCCSYKMRDYITSSRLHALGHFSP